MHTALFFISFSKDHPPYKNTLYNKHLNNYNICKNKRDALLGEKTGPSSQALFISQWHRMDAKGKYIIQIYLSFDPLPLMGLAFGDPRSPNLVVATLLVY